MSSFLLYGSYGYVGSLVAREAVDRGLEPLLAGRDPDALAEQATDLDTPTRRFDLDESWAVGEALEDVDCVLNCAGPFSNTTGPLVAGCLQTGTDYVDITGEIPVIESVAGWDEIASDVGVTLLPSAGFSTVVMDCLAAHLAERLPDATEIAVGADSVRVPSVGTLKTVVEGIEDGGAVRRDGRIEYVPVAWRSRRIDFGRGKRSAVTMPLGEVSSVYHTTGVPNVEVYAIVPQPGQLALRSHEYVAPLLSATPVKWALKNLAEAVREGPSEGARSRGSVYVWGEACDDDERLVSRLRTPDAYVVTVDAAVSITERVLAGDADAGFHTPAGAFGPEFVLELDEIDGFFDDDAVGDGESV